ncbi:type II secretion system protein [Pseudonocardiaceae bacterium YIM PH 21723]|nr:type II secretion system protein [Pseudonocardiaceae bacterium YIM PH 21723]
MAWMSAALAACAIWALPGGRAAHRLTGVLPVSRGADRPRRTPDVRWYFGGLAIAVPVLGIAVAGFGGAVAGLVLACTVIQGYRRSRIDRDRVRSATDLTAGLATLAGELRAGAQPIVAAARIGTAQRGVVSIFARLAAAARFGAEDSAVAGERSGQESSGPAAPVRQLALAWRLAQRHGIAFAPLLETIERDLRWRIRMAADLHGQLAGARTTGVVLAGLPVLAVLLGELVGAGPWHVLTGTAGGRFALVIGSCLLAAGYLWCRRLAGDPC